MDFGWPNAEIGQKMTNGRLIFLALPCTNRYAKENEKEIILAKYHRKLLLTVNSYFYKVLYIYIYI